MRNGFSLRPAGDSSAAPQVLTYEEASRQVLAENAQSPTLASADATTTEQQLAIIDPSRQSGNVAGATTDLNPDISFRSAEQIYTPQVLGAVTVNLQTQPANTASVHAYKDAMTALEANSNTLAILAALNSQDKTELTSASQNAKEVFLAMQQVPVPQGMEDYHKYQMFFYETLGNMADIYSGTRPESDMQQLTEQLFSLIQKLDSMKADIASRYGVQL
jgi:hypothetical protein